MHAYTGGSKCKVPCKKIKNEKTMKGIENGIIYNDSRDRGDLFPY